MATSWGGKWCSHNPQCIRSGKNAIGDNWGGGCAACESANVQREGQGRWAEAAGSELASKGPNIQQAGSHRSLVAVLTMKCCQRKQGQGGDRGNRLTHSQLTLAAVWGSGPHGAPVTGGQKSATVPQASNGRAMGETWEVNRGRYCWELFQSIFISMYNRVF